MRGAVACLVDSLFIAMLGGLAKVILAYTWVKCTCLWDEARKLQMTVTPDALSRHPEISQLAASFVVLCLGMLLAAGVAV